MASSRPSSEVVRMKMLSSARWPPEESLTFPSVLRASSSSSSSSSSLPADLWRCRLISSPPRTVSHSLMECWGLLLSLGRWRSCSQRLLWAFTPTVPQPWLEAAAALFAHSCESERLRPLYPPHPLPRVVKLKNSSQGRRRPPSQVK